MSAAYTHPNSPARVDAAHVEAAHVEAVRR